MGTKIEAQVETRFGDLEMFIVNAPFDQATTAIEAANGKLAKAQQVAQARIVAGPKHDVSVYGSWVAENFIYFPNGTVIVTPAEHSPILSHASKATEANRSGKEFYISDKEAANLEKLAKSDKVYTLEQNESYEIPIKKFAKDGLARFVFGDTTADYAKFLQNADVTEVPVWLSGADYQKEQKKPFARALWLHGVGYGSGLGGDGRILGSDDRVRGVRVASEASTTQKNAGMPNAYESIAQKFGYESPEAMQKDLQALTELKQKLAK